MRALIQFEGYDVLKMQYTKNAYEVCAEKEPISLCPIFSRSIDKQEGSRYSLELGVRFEQKALPFHIDLRIRGYFSLDEGIEPEKCMKVNATAILFPYLRAILTQMTTLALIPPIILPTINAVELFEASENEK